MGNETAVKSIKTALMERFGGKFKVEPELHGLNTLVQITGHRSHRLY